MSVDKRTPHTDALDFLGSVLKDGEAKRDAIHLAVEPVIAGEKLAPGAHITLSGGVAIAVKVGEGVGIVDPFLPSHIQKGAKFFLVLYPRMITSLRHVWEHPAFLSEKAIATGAPMDVTKIDSVKLIADFADSIGSDYDEVMRNAEYFRTHDEYWVEGGRFEGQGVPEGFWKAFTDITGKELKKEAWYGDNPSFFSCSC